MMKCAKAYVVEKYMQELAWNSLLGRGEVSLLVCE